MIRFEHAVDNIDRFVVPGQRIKFSTVKIIVLTIFRKVGLGKKLKKYVEKIRQGSGRNS